MPATSRTSAVFASLAVVGLLGFTAGARAQPSAEADKLRLLESMARRAHAEERYEDAVDAFEAAYLLRPDAKYVYNIGRCHERLGDIDRAIEHLELYLEQVEDPKDKADAEAVLAVLRVKAQRSDGGDEPMPDAYPEPDDDVPPPPPGPELAHPGPESTPQPVAEAEPEPPLPDGGGLGWPAAAAFASSGALLAGGAVLGVLALRAEERRDELRGTRPVPATTYIEADDEARRGASAANLLFGAGVAAAAVGVALWLLDPGVPPGVSARRHMLPAPGGVGAVLEVAP